MTNPLFKIMAALLAVVLFACGDTKLNHEQKVGIGLFCDYGPYGGGCFEMASDDDCDLEWGSVATTCGGNNPAPSSNVSSSSISSSSVKSNVSSSSNSPSIAYGSLDYGGQKYKTVKIGTQIWMAENLNYDASGSKCYDNNSSNCAKYGRLYDWETAKKVCPAGWHLPSNAEWDKLYRYVDGTSGTESPYFSSTAGRYFKATSGWSSGGNGTDQYGFSALPGGHGISDGSFSNAGLTGRWWSASEYDSGFAYYRDMRYNYETARWDYTRKYVLFSVRCLQN